ncbi:hypothetical protein Tco_0971373 [Tanacetum coccineum]
MKGQILTDFLVEKPDEVPANTSVKEITQEPWKLFTDVLGIYIAKEYNMIKYLEKTKSLVGGFDSFSIIQVPRSKNKKADALSKIPPTSFAHLSKQVLVKILKEKSIQEKEVTAVVDEEGPTWMTPILEYLKDETLPDDRKKASKLRIKARQYELWEGILYRRSFLKPWLRHPQQPLTLITAPWPVYKWGIDIAGPFPGRAREGQVLDSRYGLFHKVDRSKGHGDN